LSNQFSVEYNSVTDVINLEQLKEHTKITITAGFYC